MQIGEKQSRERRTRQMEHGHESRIKKKEREGWTPKGWRLGVGND